MRATGPILLITAATAAGAALWLAAGFAREQSLRSHLAALRSERRQVALLRAANADLQAALDRGVGLASLRAAEAQNAQFLRILHQTELLRRNLQRKLDPQTGPAWPDEAAVTRADDWASAGQGSPTQAMEHFLWAARSGDVDALAAAITFQSGARLDADAAFAQLPAGVQSKYGSPEKVIATYIAAQLPDYAAMAPVDVSNPDSTDAVVDLRLEDTTGDQRDLALLVQRGADERWRLAVPTNAVAGYVAALQDRKPPR